MNLKQVVKQYLVIFLQHPIAFGFSFFLILLFLTFIKRKKPSHKYFLVLTSITFTLSLIETASYLYFKYDFNHIKSYFTQKNIEKSGENNPKISSKVRVFHSNNTYMRMSNYQYNRYLGQLYKPNQKIVSARSMEDTLTGERELIYSVIYTSNKDGFRKTPIKPKIANKCVFFFGGSFTFGEGVNDNETLPYYFSKKTGYQVFNYGFHGWGPHHMLGILENNLFMGERNCESKTLVYQGATFHIPRSACLHRWDFGPMYKVDKTGKDIYRDGSCQILGDKRKIFGMNPLQLGIYLDSLKLFHKLFLLPRRTEKQKRELYSKILLKTIKVAETKGFDKFYILNWSCGTVDDLYKTLTHKSDWELVNTNLCSKEYKISKYDSHPNAIAHNKNANALAEKILGT